MRCQSCKYFIKTYEGEGWCSNPKYSGIVLVHFSEELCKGHGYVRESSLPPTPPPAAEETPHTP